MSLGRGHGPRSQIDMTLRSSCEGGGANCSKGHCLSIRSYLDTHASRFYQIYTFFEIICRGSLFVDVLRMPWWIQLLARISESTPYQAMARAMARADGPATGLGPQHGFSTSRILRTSSKSLRPELSKRPPSRRAAAKCCEGARRRSVPAFWSSTSHARRFVAFKMAARRS